jgi:hypothetical protein
VFRFQKPKKHSQPWTTEEDGKLVSMAPTLAVPLIAKELGRTAAAIETRAAVLKVKTFYRLPQRPRSR